MTDDDGIHLEVVYPQPIDRVWRALTTSEALAAWLMPNDFVPEVGHRFTFRTNPQEGWSGVVACEVTELDPPRRIAYTWRGGPELPPTLVSFSLDPLERGTRLRLDHTGFAAGGPAALTVRDILASGWDSKLLREQLPAYLDQITEQ
jgi:uncharacterized protein YndB with AHSA1/START domain